MFTMMKSVVFFAIAATVASYETGSRVLPLVKPSRIINGVEASVGEFPHQASLLSEHVDGYYHLCGASVIAKEWVITAAHCVHGGDPSSLAVVTDLHDFMNPGDYSFFYIDRIIVHEDYSYDDGGFPNDIALIRLATYGQDISKNIIDIANGNDDFTGQICTISGWGTTVDGSDALALNKADVTVLSHAHCTSYWGSFALDQHICVKGYDIEEGRGSCRGDSGGPLVCNGKLVGVASWGLAECHHEGKVTHPSVYADLTHFHSWVKTNCENCIA